MGIVFKQSLQNTVVTYFGFVIGAINTLVLYTRFMKDADYGLVQVVLSVSAVLMPLLSFGVPNALVKFYSGFDRSEQGHFLNLMLVLPLLFILPIALLSFLANEAIGNLLARENPVVRHYVWHIFLIGMAMAYFEVFYAWARVYLRSVFGNFMKEIFCRVGQSVLLVLLVVEAIDVPMFLRALVGLYLLRTLVMKLYAFKIRPPVLSLALPENTRAILTYSLLIILGGSTAMVLLEVDKVMLNNYLKIENVAYYGVAGFIAMTIAVPSRAMHQITYPLTAEYLNRKDLVSLENLYHRSSLTLFSISGWLFLLIILNLEDMYQLLPKGYGEGVFIVFWLGLAKLFDALLGNNNSILYNSNYYRSILILGVLLAFMAIAFNMWLIPHWGLNGAALASFSAFFIYNTLKIGYVRAKFNMVPFGKGTTKIVALLLLLGALFYFVRFPFHPILNMVLKGSLITLAYFGLMYRFKISEDLYLLLAKYLKN